MSQLKVGILEDDAIIAMSIANDLQSLGYQTMSLTNNYESAIRLIEKDRPDIMLVDIMLGQGKDGIEFAGTISQEDIPVIFVTANSDANTVARAKKVMPAAYLVKPFNKKDLYTAIEIAIHNFCIRSTHAAGTQTAMANADDDEQQYRINDAVFIRQGQYIRKVGYSDILYFESDNTHLNIHTEDRKLVLRSSLGAYLDFLGSDIFCRVHRSYAINLNRLDAIHNESVIVHGQEIPVSRMYRNDLMNSLRIS